MDVVPQNTISSVCGDLNCITALLSAIETKFSEAQFHYLIISKHELSYLKLSESYHCQNLKLLVYFSMFLWHHLNIN